MIIRIRPRSAPPATVTLADSNRFDRFHVEADPASSRVDIDAALRSSAAGAFYAGDEGPHVSVDWIRLQAGDQVSDEWTMAFDAMLEYAVRNGWFRASTNSIQAHIEFRAPTGECPGTPMRTEAATFVPDRASTSALVAAFSEEASADPAATRGLGAEEFRSLFRSHPAGVAVITADDGTGPVGLTATSVSSVSADPAMLVFSLSNMSSSSPTILSSETVVVHLLSTRDLWIAKLCATSGIDRFADTSTWDRLPTGEPYFPAAGRWIRARVDSIAAAGSATIVTVYALEGGAGREDEGDAPLVYLNRTWHSLGQHSEVGE